jgi:hypothetical protein
VRSSKPRSRRGGARRGGRAGNSYPAAPKIAGPATARGVRAGARFLQEPTLAQAHAPRLSMSLPTEPIGSIPRPAPLLAAIAEHGSEHPDLEPLDAAATRDTIARFAATGSPVITDGEQRKYHNFWTYPVHGLANAALAAS